jgi:hypothetical protein
MGRVSVLGLAGPAGSNTHVTNKGVPWVRRTVSVATLALLIGRRKLTDLETATLSAAP